MPFDILPYNPKATSDTSSPSINYPWLRNNAKAAIFLSDSMSVPKHGIIVKNGASWRFQQGHSLHNKSKSKKNIPVIGLPSDINEIEKLIESRNWPHHGKIQKQCYTTLKLQNIQLHCPSSIIYG